MSVNLQASLQGFDIDSAYTNQITLGGNVTISGGTGFWMQAGTVSISSNKTLTLGTSTNNPAGHLWTGGLITGAGTLKSQTSRFTIGSSASSFGCDLLITSSGNVVLTEMNGNLALSGASNNITIESGGSLVLVTNVSSTDAFAKGGITGGNDHYIWIQSGGTMNRGNSSYTTGGSVLVSVPVTVDGGTLNLYYAEQTGYEKNILKIQGADEDYGHSLVIINGGTLNMQAHTEMTVNNAIYVHGTTAQLLIGTGAFYSTAINGDVIFSSTGGFLKILDDSSEDFGEVTIDGDLTLTSAATVFMAWGSSDNDFLTVTGTASLAGTLTMLGNGPMEDSWTSILIAGTFSGNFNTLQWSFSSATLSSRTQSGSYQIKWNA